MDGQLRVVRAKYAFKANNNDELSFQKGDTITVTQIIDGGWWEGTLNGKTGWFPSNYVVECMPDDNPAQSPATSLGIDISVKEQHHSLVTKHLVESEGEYVNELQSFIQTYLRPLSATNTISNGEYAVLCGNILDILSFQQKFLQALCDCGKLPVSQQRVGGIFLSNGAAVRTLYHSYAANHPKSVSILSQYREELAKFMESQGANAPGSKTLTNQLSLPFRRLDKYPALLKELERHIDDAHPDRGDTQRAISVYREIQSAVVDIRKDKEMELEVLSSDISNWEGEDLISLGDVQLSAHVKVVMDDNQSSDRIMLMFPTSILMISVLSNMKYSYQGKLMLAGLKVKKLEDNDNYSNMLQLSGSMIEEMTVSFSSPSKQTAWYEKLNTVSCQVVSDNGVEPMKVPKPVISATMPPQATSKARIQNITNSAKTAHIIESYDKLKSHKLWRYSCLRPLPPARLHILGRDDCKSPKFQRKASTLGRRKNNVDDAKVLQEDAKILKVIEAYCTSVRARHTVNSSILDNPNMLIAEDEKIICEVTKDNQTFIEEKSLVDTVYVIKDQVKDLQEEFQRLKKELEEERKARKKLESLVQKGACRVPVATMNSVNSIHASDSISS